MAECGQHIIAWVNHSQFRSIGRTVYEIRSTRIYTQALLLTGHKLGRFKIFILTEGALVKIGNRITE